MLEELKRESYEANLLLPEYELIDLTFGNVSVIDRNRGILAIKPSGVSYDVMSPGDMVLVDLEGTKVEGSMNPSSDTPTHVCLFNAFENIGAVVHTHSKFATSFAQARTSIPCYGTTHADYSCDEIPITREMTADEIQGDYEIETGKVIVERFKELPAGDYPGVLVMNHGPFAWGLSGAKAVENALVMEISAEMALYTRQINPAIQPISRVLHDKHYYRKHGKDAYYGQK
jgi:L-ribulose-5-phosphate 4-epimerase